MRWKHRRPSKGYLWHRCGRCHSVPWRLPDPRRAMLAASKGRDLASARLSKLLQNGHLLRGGGARQEHGDISWLALERPAIDYPSGPGRYKHCSLVFKVCHAAACLRTFWAPRIWCFSALVLL